VFFWGSEYTMGLGPANFRYRQALEETTVDTLWGMRRHFYLNLRTFSLLLACRKLRFVCCPCFCVDSRNCHATIHRNDLPSTWLVTHSNNSNEGCRYFIPVHNGQSRCRRRQIGCVTWECRMEIYYGMGWSFSTQCKTKQGNGTILVVARRGPEVNVEKVRSPFS